MKPTQRVTRIHDIQGKKIHGEKIVMLTAYSAWMARLLDESGAVDLLLVGDSLGMVELGFETTIPVTLDDMVRHSRAVRNGAPHAFVVADLPFLTYHTGEADAIRSAGRLIQEGGASAVKLEGGAPVAGIVRRIVDAGIPVMGHLGLLPQSIHQLGGYRQQAKAPQDQDQLLRDAKALEDAGAFSLVVECVPETLAARVTATCRIPVIGIGAGSHCDGQVLVTHDVLGLSGTHVPGFAKRYADLGEVIRSSAQSFSNDVRQERFPVTPEGQNG